MILAPTTMPVLVLAIEDSARARAMIFSQVPPPSACAT